MVSQYQHRQFFRRVPNALLARYFETRDTDLGVDFRKLKETEVEPVFQAFTALPEEQQAVMRTTASPTSSGNATISPPVPGIRPSTRITSNTSLPMRSAIPTDVSTTALPERRKMMQD